MEKPIEPVLAEYPGAVGSAVQRAGRAEGMGEPPGVMLTGGTPALPGLPPTGGTPVLPVLVDSIGGRNDG
jgi:hypothetical protein